METPRMALAPSLPLLAVPSSLMRKSSICFCEVTGIPALMSSGAMTSLTFETALVTPVSSAESADGSSALIRERQTYPCQRRRSCRRREARQPRAHQSRLRKARQLGRGPWRCRGQPRQWGYHASRTEQREEKAGGVVSVTARESTQAKRSTHDLTGLNAFDRHDC